jgi:hypothetical protein
MVWGPAGRWPQSWNITLALVCAAKSCPPLVNRAYTGPLLNQQLDDRAREFLAGPEGLRIDRQARVVYFSSIFKWHGEDFVADHAPASGFSGLGATERAVAHFAGAYLPPPDREFLAAGGYKLHYLNYD